jgi:hypothetical protein
VAPVRPRGQIHREHTGFVAYQSVRHRRYRAVRAAALVLVAGCTLSFTTFLGGVALADPPPPSPTLSTTPAPSPTSTSSSSPAPAVREQLHLALSTTQGTPGTSFTATATGAEACDRLPAAVAESTGVKFDAPFSQQHLAAGSDSVSVTFTVPENATPGTYEVTASCSGPGNAKDSATFTVTEQPGLTLSPPQGTPGQTRVTATPKGVDACLGGGSSVSQTMSWQWDEQPLQTSTTGGDGSTVTFVVPADASPSEKHTVTAWCGRTGVTAPFKVVAAPALKLDKPQGTPGSQVMASGTGFACGDDRVDLLWDGRTSLTDGPSGTFSVQLTIPADASISQHTVVASCRNHADITDSQSFTVIKDTVGVATPAALTLDPPRGAPGDPVHVTGDGFACTDSSMVLLSWDGRLLGDLSADASGHFDTSISVPADAPPSSHLVRAACSAGSAAATAGFTVVGSLVTTTTTGTTPPPPLPPPDLSGLIAVCLVLLVVAVLAVVAYRHGRKPRHKPTPRVYATVSPTSGLPLVTTSETPAHGEVTHALRLRVHADVGTQTISEVESDYTT